MQYLSGVTFPHQKLTPKQWGKLFFKIFADGIVDGCNVTYSGNNVYISEGLIVLCGRLISVPATVTEVTSPTYSNGYGRLKVCINTNNESTSESNKQSFVTTEYSATSDFPALTKEDINADGDLYEEVLANIRYSNSSISEITPVMVSVAPIPRITYGTTDPPEKANEGDIYIKIPES